MNIFFEAPALTPNAALEDTAAVVAEVQHYIIQRGDTLYGITKEFYSNGMKYPDVFEAYKEMILDPDKNYPGQKIRISAQPS